MLLIEKIHSRNTNIAIIGLGYVGLPLAMEFYRAGFRVTGFDIDTEKGNVLKQGKSYLKHINASLISRYLSSFNPTTDFARLSEMDCIIICVPTPLNKYREPDMAFVFNTTKTIAQHLRQGQLVVLESTTYPGTTDEYVRAIREKTELKVGRDFSLAFSPERDG